jgi:hypothetical protein
MLFRFALVLLATISLACGGETPTAPAAERADVRLRVTIRDMDLEVFEATGELFTSVVALVEVSERGGVGISMTSVALDVVDDTGQLVASRAIHADQLVEFVGDNRLEANDTEIMRYLPFFLRGFHPLDSPGRMTVRFIDVEGNVSNSSIDITLDHPGYPA